jgi:hypothetical protein
VTGDATHNQQLIVIAGPNGAGKSTLAPFLLRDKLGLPEYVNADTIAQGLSAFLPDQPLAETWGVYDNSVSPTPTLIATGSATSQSILLPELWRQFKEAA